MALRGVVISSAPFAAVYYGAIELTQGVVVGAVLVVLNVLTSLANRLSEQGAKPPDYASEGLVRFGDLLSSFKRDAVRGGVNREAAIEACLGIIETIALPATKSKKGEISVTLITYQGTGHGRMKVRKRNPGNTRPANREFGTERILGHHVCERGSAPMIVNNIKHFGKEFAQSPTQTSYDYKSILIIPLPCDDASGEWPKGFVSIDCNRPYAFYGNRANGITVMSAPIVQQLREMV